MDGTATRDGLFGLALLGAAAVAGRFALWARAMWVSHVATSDIEQSVRIEVTEHLARLPLGWFGSRRSGEIKKILAEDIGRLELFVAHAVPELLSALVYWLVVTTWLFALDWRLAAATAMVVPVGFALLVLVWRGTMRKVHDYEAAEARMNGSIVELLVGLPVLKVFQRAQQALGETRQAIDHYVTHQTQWSREYFPIGSVFYTVVNANVVVVLTTGMALSLAGAVTTNTLLLFLLLGLGYSLPLLRFYNLGAHAVFIASAIVAVQQILDEPPLPDSGRRVDLDGHDVEFRQVSFAYNGDLALDNVSFVAREGQVTALVGPSGAGKTTVARLIARFADPDIGAVLVGGVDVRAMAVGQLMDTVALVAQDPFLFHDTVAANIRVGRPSATAEEVEAAAQAARAHDFIQALPLSYDTMVGERGATSRERGSSPG